MNDHDMTREQLLEELRVLRSEAARRSATVPEAGPFEITGYRRLLETANEGIWILNADLCVIYVNPRMAEMIGYTPEEILGRTPYDFLHEADHAEARRLLARRRLGIKEQFDFRFRRKDGSDLWSIISSNPVLDDWGHFRATLGMFTDITPRKQAEEALRQSEERFRAVLTSISDAVFLTDRDGAFTFVGPSVRVLFGYSEQETQALGNIRALLGADLFDPERLEAEGEIPNIERTIIDRDGKKRVLLVTVKRVAVKDGDLLYTCRDITDRKKAEEALHESDARQRLLLEQMPAILYSTDTELLFTSGVGAGLRALNLRPNELSGTSITAYLGTSDPNFPPLAAQREALAGKSTSFELEWQTRAFQVHIEPLRNAQGTITGTLGLALDVTERKQAEQTLQEYADRLQTLSHRLLEVQEQERRHLARELHDEIGQLITGLKLTLEAGAGGGAEGLRQAVEGAQRMIRELTGRLRDLSLRLRPPMLDDLGLLPTLLWHLNRYTLQTGVRVHLEHAGLERRFASEVETAAYRIVQEALTNVARHAGVEEAEVRVWSSRDALFVKVEDNGKGFDAEAARAGGSSGLSGMLERAGLLGGRLEVESTPGRGTCLSAELPVTESEMRKGDAAENFVGGRSSDRAPGTKSDSESGRRLPARR
jgi:PAS domain S-box-containing protein